MTGNQARIELVDLALIAIANALNDSAIPAARHNELGKFHAIVVDEIVTLRKELEALQPQPEAEPEPEPPA